MKRTILLTTFLFGFFFFANAQLNDYKYIVVPKRFDIFRNTNEYQTSVLIKKLFSEQGFNVIYDDTMPVDYAQNRCLGLKADINDVSSLFMTKLTLTLKDCNDVLVFDSVEGKSKEKDYKLAFRESIFEAFESYKGLNYSYQPKERQKAAESVTVSIKDEVTSSSEPMVQKEEVPTTAANVSQVLYAKSVENGFQLVDAEANIVLRMTKSAMENVFLIEDSSVSGMVYLKDGKWYQESTESGQKSIKELNIEF